MNCETTINLITKKIVKYFRSVVEGEGGGCRQRPCRDAPKAPLKRQQRPIKAPALSFPSFTRLNLTLVPVYFAPQQQRQHQRKDATIFVIGQFSHHFTHRGIFSYLK